MNSRIEDEGKKRKRSANQVNNNSNVDDYLPNSSPSRNNQQIKKQQLTLFDTGIVAQRRYEDDSKQRTTTQQQQQQHQQQNPQSSSSSSEQQQRYQREMRDRTTAINNSTIDPSTAAGNTSSSSSSSVRISHDRVGHRFHTTLGSDSAFLDYTVQDDGRIWNIYETSVPPSLRNRGLAAQLCLAAFNTANNEDITIIPQCSYVKDQFLTKYPQWKRIIHGNNKETETRQTQPRQHTQVEGERPQQQQQQQPTSSGTATSRNDQTSSLKPGYPSTTTRSRSPFAIERYPHRHLLLHESAPLPPNHCPLPHHPILKSNHFLRLLATIDAYESTPVSLTSVITLFARLSQHTETSLGTEGIDWMVRSVMNQRERKEFFECVIPFAIQRVKELPIVFPTAAVPLLTTNVSGTVHLTKMQTATLLSCSLFGLHAAHKGRGGSRYTIANFYDLFSSIGLIARIHHKATQKADQNGTELQWSRSGRNHNNNVEKMRCLFQYFTTMQQRYKDTQQRSSSSSSYIDRTDGIITFHRRVLSMSKQSFIQTILSSTSLSLPDFTLFGAGATIEDDFTPTHSLHLDFANKYIGGGVLSHGCVQEEILFTICPECLCSLLFTEVMADNEALIIVGAERFTSYRGYGSGFEYAGIYDDCIDEATDELGRRRKRRAIVAIDAIPFRRPINQWTQDAIIREIYKAYAGFSLPTGIVTNGSAEEQDHYTTLSTGNWGCGAFLGDVPLKAMIQVIAASLAGRGIRYFTFGDPNANGLGECVAHLLSLKIDIATLFKHVLRYAALVCNKSDDAEDTLLLYLLKLGKNPQTQQIEKKHKSGEIRMKDQPQQQTQPQPQLNDNDTNISSSSTAITNSDMKDEIDEVKSSLHLAASIAGWNDDDIQAALEQSFDPAMANYQAAPAAESSHRIEDSSDNEQDGDRREKEVETAAAEDEALSLELSPVSLSLPFDADNNNNNNNNNDNSDMAANDNDNDTDVIDEVPADEGMNIKAALDRAHAIPDSLDINDPMVDPDDVDPIINE